MSQRHQQRHEGGTLRLRVEDAVEASASAQPVGPVRLLAAHGFVNEYDAKYYKPAGAVITNPVEIAMLRERGAPLQDA